MNSISPQRILIPGIYEMPHDAYHADCCETPSLSAGMINDMLVAPALCRENSSRLNPEWEEPVVDKFSLGTVAHVMFLEPHLFDERVVVVEHEDWKKNVAKDARTDARLAGKTAILAKHMESIHAMRAVFLRNPFTKMAFERGTYEQSFFWKHPEYGFWCRARADFIAEGFRHLNDYKTTGNADPEQFGRHAFQMGYHRRAAWYLDGITAITGTAPAHYWFCNQETKRPFLTSVIELDEDAIEAGRAENDKAARLFAHCLSTGDWFGYRHHSDWTRDLAFKRGLPPFALTQIDMRISQ